MRKHLIHSLVIMLMFAGVLKAAPVHEAVNNGDLEAVKAILEADPKQLDARDENGDAPLHLAVSGGFAEIAEFLISAGADVNVGDSENLTPLYIAAANSNTDISGLLIAHGASVNHRDSADSMPLHYAAIGGDTTIIALMLNHGAEVNGVNTYGITPLRYAVGRRHPEATRLLLSWGADALTPNMHGQTPIFDAARGGLVENVELLMAHGASIFDIDSTGLTVLMDAANLDRNVDMVVYLIGARLDPNQSNNSGETSLYMAVRRGNLNIAQALLENGANPDIKPEALGNGYTPLHMATVKGNVEAVKLLLNNNADIQVRDKNGRTALYYAGKYGFKQVADFLEGNGAKEPDMERNFGRAPQLDTAIPTGEAFVWYLGHAGWAIKTANNLLIFDYQERFAPPSNPSISNGHITAEELKGLKTTVFVSHEHRDHFDTTIFKWRDVIPDIEYIMGFEADSVDEYIFLGPRQSRKVGNLEIATIESNDSGVGFLVKVDGLTIFHGGDHANRQRDFSGPFAAEINYLADMDLNIDLAFMSIVGCGFGDREAVKLGVYRAIEKLKLKVLFPQHAADAEYYYKNFATTAFEEIDTQSRILPAENGGDRFFYRGGEIF